MAIKRRDDRVRLDTILKESTGQKRVLWWTWRTRAGSLIGYWDETGFGVHCTVQHAFYKDNIKKRKCDHKENLKSKQLNWSSNC